MVGKLARLLAPIALASVALGIYLLAHSALATHTPAATRSSTTVVNTQHTVHRGRRQPKYYVVKAGDSLSAIAAKTGVGIARITSLNPSVSAPPYSLQTGQRLRLRR
jgi:LysM repeat protein